MPSFVPSSLVCLLSLSWPFPCAHLMLVRNNMTVAHVRVEPCVRVLILSV